ncbi:MAG: UDP-N-acetylmuramate--L-alanine ligase [Acidobacteriota bacterium]
MKLWNQNLRRIHFVGIGGMGMNGLAEVLVRSGYAVSGSDLRESFPLRRLRQLGARIQIGHEASNLGQAQLVVYSTAVPLDNPEVREAMRKGLVVQHRSEVLAELMRHRWGIAVSGTHGKTTVASMIATVLLGAGLDPTAIIGARLPSIGGNARLGKGHLLVAEADESDRSFLRLPAVCSVVTNIDMDHMDVYRDLQDLGETFLKFMNNSAPNGQVVACGDDRNLSGILKRVHREVVTYGTMEEARVRGRKIRLAELGSSYDCYLEGHFLGSMELKVPGCHNVLNSLAAVAVGLWLKIPFPLMASSLGAFEGAQRRLDRKGEKDGVLVIDDYAHHPAEISASLEACRHMGRRIITIFQPHRYSRTQHLMTKMNACFGNSDRLYLLDIYGAGEAPLPGVTSERLAAEIRHHRDVTYVPNKELMLDLLGRETRPGDLILTLGAGNVNEIGEEFLEQESDR